MPIETSMYNNNPVDSFSSAFDSGMRMGDIAKKRREENELKEIYKQSMVTAPDGSISLDQKTFLGNLSQKDPEKAMAYQKEFATQEKMKVEAENARFQQAYDRHQKAINLLGAATDQKTYDLAINQGIKLGLVKPGELPPQYDPVVQKNLMGQLLTQKERMEMGFKERETTVKEVEAQAKLQEQRNKRSSGEALPVEKKKFVETLGTKNANKVAIKNQIDAVTSNWDNLPDDQKLSAGRQLLKTLNSPEGADAIGVEEANRLGSRLEYALGNFTNSNPTQFGRDLKGFKEQAQNTSKSLETAIKSNEGEIDKAYGRKASMAPQKKFKTSEIDWK